MQNTHTHVHKHGTHRTDSLASLRAPGQSLTGELGVDLAKNTPESWLHSAVGAINAKKWVLALAFFLLVAALTTATGVELSENVWGMVDKNAGKRLKVHVPTEEEHYSKEAESGSGVSTTLDVSDDEDELGRKEAERLTKAEAGGEEEGGDDSAAAEEGTD